MVPVSFTSLASVLPDAAAHLTAAGGHIATLGPDWLDPTTMIDTFIARWGDAALIGIAVVIFIETGLLFPILPGDSLLFMAGAFVATGKLSISLPLLCLILFAAAFAGDQTAYVIGRKFGPRIFDRPDSRFFKRKYIDQTNAYFDKYGGRTIVIARFVPIVRTYAPVAAGVGKMHYRHFVGFNALGALMWAVGVTILGYLLGNVTFVKENIEVLLILIVLISVIPMVVEVLRARATAKKEGAATAGVAPGAGSEAHVAPTGASPTGESAPGASAPGEPAVDPHAPHPPRHARRGH